MSSAPTIALIGNPNCGKTLIFNSLTRSHQRVGNWSGVTVERFEGRFHAQGKEGVVVDLPGCYALDSHDGSQSLDTQVAYRAVIAADYDLIVNVVDAAHLERHLYLTMQLLELGKPMVVVVNRLDCAERQGIRVDTAALGEALGCPVIGISAVKKLDMKRLRGWLADFVFKQLPGVPVPHQEGLPDDLRLICEQVSGQVEQDKQGISGRFWALRMLEGDDLARIKVMPQLSEETHEALRQLRACYEDELDIYIADQRYRRIHALIKRAVIPRAKRIDWTECIDRWCLDRWLGIPLFLLIIYLTFVIAVVVGGMLQDSVDILASHLFVDYPRFMLQRLNLPYTDGIIALVTGLGQGLTVTLTFIPILAMLFFCLSWLEDCGYMARAAVVVDRLMRLIGLPGESFVALIIGLGCNVPAIMATRTLTSHRDRILTAMMAPFMSCTARLTIYALFAAAFFQQARGGVVMLLYLSGIAVAIVTGWVLRLTVLPGRQQDLVVELPDYSMPRWGAIGRRALLRLKGFVIRSAQWIVPICAVLSWLSHIDTQGHWVTVVDERVLLAQMSKALTMLFAPIGIQADNWPATVALLTGVVAKEVVIGTLASLYHVVHPAADVLASWGSVWHDAVQSLVSHVVDLPQAVLTPLTVDDASHEMGLIGALRLHFASNSAALAYLFFVLLYFPCISTLATMVKELGARWGIISLLWGNVVAYAGAVIVYQGLNWYQHPLHSAMLMVSVMAVVLLFALTMRWWRVSAEGVL